MKKSLLIFVCLSMFICKVFSQSAGSAENFDPSKVLSEEFSDKDRVKTEVIIPENQHTSEKSATVKIEYSPMYDEVRIYYDCMFVNYDAGEAMNTVLECLRDFQLEHKYYGYRYLKADRLKHYKSEKGLNMVQYISHVKFNR